MSKPGEKLLLDTSVIIKVFKNDREAIETLASAAGLYVPVVAYGELYVGALKSAVPQKKLDQLAEFIRATALIDVDWRTAQHYGNLRKQLEAKGKPIPENDLWIASVAVQHDLKLYTSDTHFESIEGIQLLSK